MKTKELTELLNKRSRETGRSQDSILNDACNKLEKILKGCRQPQKKEDAEVLQVNEILFKYGVAVNRIRKIRITEIEVA